VALAENGGLEGPIQITWLDNARTVDLPSSGFSVEEGRV
jgi:hypothetical protein